MKLNAKTENYSNNFWLDFQQMGSLENENAPFALQKGRFSISETYLFNLSV